MNTGRNKYEGKIIQLIKVNKTAFNEVKTKFAKEIKEMKEMMKLLSENLISNKEGLKQYKPSKYITTIKDEKESKPIIENTIMKSYSSSQLVQVTTATNLFSDTTVIKGPPLP